LEVPVLRFCHVVGTIAYVKPRVTAFSGSSTVRLKCCERSGCTCAITLRR